MKERLVGKNRIEMSHKYIQHNIDNTVTLEHVESGKQIAHIVTKPLGSVEVN